MTTATLEKPKLDAVAERARKKKLGHVHVLAQALFDHFIAKQCHVDVSCVDSSGRRVLQDFQKSLILEAAARLGFPVQSRAELSPMQLGAICTRLRERMEVEGIPIPRSGKKRGRKPDSDAAATDEQMQLIYDLAGQCMTAHGWTEQTFARFLQRQLGGRREIRSVADANAVLFGLKGVLRHTDTEVRG